MFRNVWLIGIWRSPSPRSGVRPTAERSSDSSPLRHANNRGVSAPSVTPAVMTGAAWLSPVRKHPVSPGPQQTWATRGSAGCQRARTGCPDRRSSWKRPGAPTFANIPPSGVRACAVAMETARGRKPPCKQASLVERPLANASVLRDLLGIRAAVGRQLEHLCL